MIRRPMLFAACGCGAAVVVSYYCGTAVSAAVLSAAACGMLLHGKGKESGRRRTIAILLLISYCLGFASFWHMDRALAKEAAQLTENSIRGEITDCEWKTTQTGDRYLQMTLRTEQGRMLCKSYDNCNVSGEAAEGCVAEVAGKLQDPRGKRNPGCFDYALYLKSLGVTKTMTCSSMTVYPPRPFSQAPLPYVRNLVFRAREGFIGQLTERTDQSTSGLIRAILFGDKGSLDENVLDAFRKNGTAHILAVSGLHIGIIYGFILKLWRWRRGWTFLLFNTVFFLFYSAAAGFSPSVTRAVIMVLLHIAASIRNRRYDLANAAFLVFLCVILRNPFMVFNTGFQMSFLAVLTLVMVLPYMKKIYTGIFLTSAAVQIGLGPFILFSFNWLSLLAVFVNVPVVALAGIIVPLALVSMSLCVFGGSVLFGLSAHLLDPMCSALVKLNETTQIDGITTIQLPSPPLWLMAFYYLCLLLFATEEGRLCLIRTAHKGRYVLKMVVIIIMLSVGFAAFASDGFEDCDLTFVDVGQGDCICVRTEGSLWRKEGCYMFDGGGSADYNVGKSVLREYLLKNGTSHVDGAFVTHLHTDHYKGICELARLGMVDRLYVYEANRLKEGEIMKETGLAADDIVYLGAGDRVKLVLHNHYSVYVEVMYPERRSEAEYTRMMEQETDENLMSLVFKVTYSGSRGNTSVLITGDLGEEGEQELIQKYGASGNLRSDILKVGHHGSKTSTTEEFLDAVDPEIAVIQVGMNNMYGHPTPEILDRLSKAGAFVYRNDLIGAVGIDISDGEVKEVKKMIEQ